MDNQDTSVAHATAKIEAVVVTVEGRYYIVRENSGREIYLLVTSVSDVADSVKPGDRVEVWMSPVEHAVSIRAKVPQAASSGKKTNVSTITGTISSVNGEYYVVDGIDGKTVRIHVNQDTEVSGRFKTGDEIEVVFSPIEHAAKIRLSP